MNIRKFQPTDTEYEALTAVSNAVFPDYPHTPGEWRYEDDQLDLSKYARGRYVAEDPETGKITGWGEYRHRIAFFHPQRYWLSIEVHPDHRRHGIGGRLYETLLEDLAQLDAAQLQANVEETMPHCLEFALKRGFSETCREWESRVDPRQFDPDLFRSYLERVAAEGLEIVTLAELKDTDPDWLPKLYDLHVAVESDAPSPDPYTGPTKDHFLRSELESPWALHDAFFVARDGDRYVGESYLISDLTDPEALYQGLTGVRREYRRRGIAMALKVRVMEYARAHGCKKVKTWNSTLNEGMLAVNHKLGFTGYTAWIQLEKRLDRIW